MNCCRVRRPLSATAEAVIPFAANAINSFPHRKVLLLGASLAALPVGVAVPIVFRADRPPVAASSTLKCYDSGGNHEPCLTQASAPPQRPDSQTTTAPRPASWTIAALYQPESWATTELDQPAASTTSAPAAQRSSMRGKRRALALCRQRLIPCFFSTLRRGLTHIASVAASVGRPRPAREHL
jgi:hypothetical protein